MRSAKQRFDAHTRVRGLSFVAMLALAFAARAAGADFVALNGGNQMTGEIEALEHGRLTFDIDSAGTVSINWRNVVGLRSSQPQNIELTSGERLQGPVDFKTPGTLEVATDVGPKSIAMADIIRMRPVATTFLDRLTGDVDLGFDFLSAHDEIDWTLNASLVHRTDLYVTELGLSSLVRRHDDDTTQQRNHLDVDVRRLLQDRWFVVGLFVGEEDLELDLDLRLLLGAAVGRTLVQSQRTEFALYGGVDVSHEEFSGPSPDDGEVVELLGAVRWDWFEVGGDYSLGLKATTYVAPDDGRVRFELDSSVRRSFASDFFLSLNVYESYNSDPPAGSESSDLGVSITFGRTFR